MRNHPPGRMAMQQSLPLHAPLGILNTHTHMSDVFFRLLGGGLKLVGQVGSSYCNHLATGWPYFPFVIVTSILPIIFSVYFHLYESIIFTKISSKLCWILFLLQKPLQRVEHDCLKGLPSPGVLETHRRCKWPRGSAFFEKVGYAPRL